MNPTRPPMPSMAAPYGGHPPPPNVPDPRQRIARFKTLTRRALRFWRTALPLFLVGCALALAVATRVQRVYHSEAVILFKPGMTGNPDENPSERALRLAPKLNEMLTSRQRLEPLIKEFNLYPRIVDSRGLLDAVEEMKKVARLRGRDSETFIVLFDGEDAQVTQKVTQRLAETVIDEFMRSNVSSTSKQVEFLQLEMKRSEDDIERSNRALAVFLAGHPEFAASASAAGQGGAGLNLPQQAFSAMRHPSGDGQLGMLLDQKRRIEQEAAQAAGQPAAPPPPPQLMARIEALQRAKDEAYQRYAAAQADFSEKKAQYTEQHPDYIASKQTLGAAQAAAQASEADLAKAKAEIPPPPQVAPSSMSPDLRARLDDVNRQIAARQAEMRHTGSRPPVVTAGDAGRALTPAIVELETEWQRLLRSVREAKSAHEDIKLKYDRAKLQNAAVAGAGGDQLEMLDPAFLPSRPSSGGRTRAALAGGAVAALLAILYAYGRVVFSDSLIDAGDVESLNVIPVLGVMPRIPNTGGSTAMTPPKGGSPSGV